MHKNFSVNLSGKIVFITGSTKGIGLAIAKLFYSHGAKVVIHGSTIESVENTLFNEGIPFLGGEVFDLEQVGSLNHFVEKMYNKYKKIDILVNNAGIGISENFYEDSIQMWLKLFNVNFFAAVELSKLVTMRMKDKNIKGKIINISSIVGKIPKPYFPAYSTSKAAMIHFTKIFSQIAGENSINVNCILPGSIETMMTEESVKKYSKSADISLEDANNKLYTSKISLKKMGTVNDIAWLALYLGSNYANYLTGACIDVNGGYNYE